MRCTQRRTRRLVVAAVCVAIASALRAQNASRTPDITVSTHLVQISVIVRDSKGNPASGLTRDDFIVRDKGQPRKLSVFEVESSGAAPGPASGSAPALAPNTFSNRAETVTGEGRATGSITLIVLDNLNTLVGSMPDPYEDTPDWAEDHALASAKRHLLQALQQMDPRDRIAVYGLSGTLRMLCDFTCSREELLAAVTRYDPTSQTMRDAAEPGAYQIPTADERFSKAADAGNKLLAGQQNQLRAQATMPGLKAIADHVARIPGRKNLIWLTADLPLSGEAMARILAPANIAAYPVDARGLLPLQMDPNALSSAGPIQVKPFKQPGGIPEMQEVAEDTGGHAYVNTNDLTGAIREVAEDTGARYTLGFYVEEASVDGKFHELKVRTKPPGLELHGPKGYFAVKDAPPAGRGQSAIWAALENPYPATAIPLDITAAHVERPRPHMLSLTGSVGIETFPVARDGDLRHAVLDVLVVEQDAAGNVLHQATNHMDLRLTEAQYQVYLKSGVTFQQALVPQEKTAVVRVLVREPKTLQLGSVVIPVKQVR